MEQQIHNNDIIFMEYLQRIRNQPMNQLHEYHHLLFHIDKYFQKEYVPRNYYNNLGQKAFGQRDESLRTVTEGHLIQLNPKVTKSPEDFGYSRRYITTRSYTSQCIITAVLFGFILNRTTFGL